MSITKPTPAFLAARWIIQRLRELVRYRPLAASTIEAIGRRDYGGDNIQRSLDQAAITRLRRVVLRQADGLLALLNRIGSGITPFPSVPADVSRELTRLRREDREERDRLAVECEWLDRQVEFEVERMRCWHDEDTSPSPADYGLDEHDDAPKPAPAPEPVEPIGDIGDAIDRRLRELVTHQRPLAEAIIAALDDRPAADALLDDVIEEVEGWMTACVVEEHMHSPDVLNELARLISDRLVARAAAEKRWRAENADAIAAFEADL